jgi:hypothetical protein
MSSSGPDDNHAWLQVGAAALKHCVASGCIPEATLLLEAMRNLLCLIGRHWRIKYDIERQPFEQCGRPHVIAFEIATLGRTGDPPEPIEVSHRCALNHPTCLAMTVGAVGAVIRTTSWRAGHELVTNGA